MPWVRDRLGRTVWSDAAPGASNGDDFTQPIGGPDDIAPPPANYAHIGPTAPGAFSFGNLDNKQDIAYNTPGNYGVGYQKLVDWANPNNSSGNYGSWLASQAGEVQNRYNDAAFQQGTDASGQTLKWVDYLERMAPGFRTMFNGLSAKSRGENPALYDSGVYLG